MAKLPEHKIHKGNHGVVTPSDSQNVTTDGVAEVVSGATDVALNTAALAPLAVPLVASAAGVVGSIGEKVGLDSIAKAGRSTQSSIEEFTKKTIADLFSERKSAQRIADAAQEIADGVGGGLNKAGNTFGLPKIFQKVGEIRGGRRIEKIDKLIGKVNASVDIPSELRTHVQKIGDLAKIGNADHHEVTEAFSKAIEASKNLSSKDSKILKKLNEVAGSHFTSGSFKNIGDGIKALPKAIGNAPVLTGVMNTGFIASSAIGMFSIAKEFQHNLTALKKMSSDITGKPVSTFSVLFGKTPAPVAEARSKLLKGLAISEASSAAALGSSVVQAVKGSVSTAGFLVPQLVGMGANMLVGESSLSSYTTLSQAHALGKEIPVKAYAELVGKASPELRARGAEGSVFSKKLAEQYAAEKTSPAQVMREVSNGKLMKRVYTIIAANDLAKPVEAASVAANNKLEHSHVAALEKKKQPEKKHTVVGGHTAKLAANTGGQANHVLGGA
jgi:hypothetical protein